MKRCSKCKQSKPLSDYYRNRVQSDGFQVWCKKCVKDHQNLKRQEDPQKYSEYQKAWFARHPGYFRKYSRKRRRGKGSSMIVFEED